MQRLDQYRKWTSLDDQRYCLVCCKMITGRQIEVLGGDRSNDPLRLRCPTENCSSVPLDWVLPKHQPRPDSPPTASAILI